MHGQPNNFRLNYEIYSTIASSIAGQCTSADRCCQENSNWSEEGWSTVHWHFITEPGLQQISFSDVSFQGCELATKHPEMWVSKGKTWDLTGLAAVGTSLYYTTLMLVAYVCILVSMLVEHKQTVWKELKVSLHRAARGQNLHRVPLMNYSEVKVLKYKIITLLILLIQKRISVVEYGYRALSARNRSSVKFCGITPP